MKYIPRVIEPEIIELFSNADEPRGLILAGIVGCGKTTLASHVLKRLEDRYTTFSFTSDDVQFRRLLIEETTSLHKLIRSRTTAPTLVFIDETQKCEEAFDAVKYAYDQGGVSFIISGSNPAYLNTVARKRLQRRAQLLTLHPFAPAEVVADALGVEVAPYGRIVDLVSGKGWGWIRELPPLELKREIQETMERYVRFGGLPGVWRQQGAKSKLKELQAVAERGFEPASDEASAFADIVRIALAQMNSREFTYETIFQRTRTSKRHKVNAIIDELINHGYLLKKSPRLFHPSKISYLFVLSWTDPGFVHYFTGADPWEHDRGFTIESIVHTALARIAAFIPTKVEVGYYKPYTIDANDKVKYRQGEIDFLFQAGTSLVPIEVKSTAEIGSIDVSLMKRFMDEHGARYGIICYGGVPSVDERLRIVYWPYWWM